MKTLELKVDKAKIESFVVNNTLHAPSKDFSSYTFYAMSAASAAQELRQKTVGRGDDVQRQIDGGRLKKDNPTGFYFLSVESALLKFSSSLSYIASTHALDGIVEDDKKDSLINAANQRLGRVLGTFTGTRTEGLAANVEQHYQCLQELVNLYNQGLEMRITDSGLTEGHSSMMTFLRKEIEHANKVLGKSGRFRIF